MRMDRADKIGIWVSAALHLAVIVWAIVGTSLFPTKPSEPVEITPAGMISEAEFAALQAAAPKAGEATPSQPDMPALAEPAPQATPPEITPEVAPAPEPVPEPPAEPSPEPAPDMSALTEPTPPAEVTEVPPSMLPPVEEPQDTTNPAFAQRPRPKPAQRVAPTPSEAPAPDAKVSDTAVAETRPEESAEPEKPVEPPKEEAAPPEATTEIVTEAEKTEEKPETSAMQSSPRPRPKPAALKPDAPKPAADKPAAEKPAAKPAASDALNDALAEAMAGESATAENGTGTGGLGIAENGPPVTAGEKEAMVLDVKGCWNVGALSSEALRTTVTVRFDMEQNGKPVVGSIELVGHEGGSEAAAKQAYEAARRAIVRCGSDGFPLPAEKYAWWKQVEIVFNPTKMRMK